MEIKTKYNLEDKVWALVNNTPKEITIVKIKFMAQRNTRNSLWYADSNGNGYTEQRLFSTKEELLKSL